MPDPDIFLSYNREDADRARQFATALAAEGFDVWWDAALRSGEAYDEVTENALHGARAVVVLWSPRSVVSRWVRAEATVADQNKTLMPVTIEPCRRPVMFELTQTAELSHWHGDVKDPAWRALVGDVRALIAVKSGAPPTETTPPQAADANEPGETSEPPPALSKLSERLSGVFGKSRVRPVLLALALLLAALGAWAIFEANFGSASHDRIPLVVRTLAASSGDQTETALASGITDELIVRLRQVPELRVATAEPDGSVPGDAFERAYIVEGSIRSSGDRLRVTARLLDPGGEILWSQTSDHRLAEMFDVQEQIAASISRTLSVSFDVGIDSTEYGGTNNPEAYAAYLQWSAHQLDLDQSVPLGHLQRALALDPQYVKALTGLATHYALQSNFAASRREALALMDKADNASARAIAANPGLWAGYVSRGWYHGNRPDVLSADRSFRRAAALDKGVDPELRSNLAAYAANGGRSEEALSILDSMEAIEPGARLHSVRVWALVNLGRAKEAIELFEEIAARHPGAGSGIPQVFWAYLILNGEEDALRFDDQIGGRFGDNLRAYKADEQMLLSKSTAGLRQWATSRYGEVGQGNLTGWALFAGYYGHPKLAVDLQRLGLERPGGYGSVTLWYPTLAEARGTDEFEQLVTDFGFVKMWRETGKWNDFCRPVSATEISCH